MWATLRAIPPMDRVISRSCSRRFLVALREVVCGEIDRAVLLERFVRECSGPGLGM